MPKVNNQDASRLSTRAVSIRISPNGLMKAASQKGYYKGGIAFDPAECFTLGLGFKFDGSRSVHGD